MPKSKSREAYVIVIVARAKHLKPKLTDSELVNKLSYHFDRDINVAVMTRGTTTIEELLLMLAQWEKIRYSLKQQPRSDAQPRPGPSLENNYENRQQQNTYTKKPYLSPRNKYSNNNERSFTNKNCVIVYQYFKCKNSLKRTYQSVNNNP